MTKDKISVPDTRLNARTRRLFLNHLAETANVSASARAAGVALTAPALTDSDIGKCWLVGSGATGLWTNKSGQIAIWIGGDWRYLVAHDGMRLWNRSNGRDSIYTGGVWRSGPIIANPSGGAVVDIEARATLGAMLQYFRLIGILTP